MLRVVVCAFVLTLLNTITKAEQAGHTEQKQRYTITLEDVVRSVQNSHLIIQREDSNVERSSALAQQSSGPFDWNVTAESGYRRPRVPKSNQKGFLTTETERNNVYNVALGVKKQFRNGIVIAPGVSYSQNSRKNSSDVLANSIPFVGHIAIKVPLLRGRGNRATTALEKSAQEVYKSSELTKEHTKAKVLVNAISHYWQSVEALRNLNMLRLAGNEATAITETRKKLSEQGELSVLEYQSSVANLNLRRLKIEKSAATWNSTRRNLARLIENSHKIKNLPITEDDFPNITMDETLIQDENSLIDLAFEQRRDLLALQATTRSKHLNLLKMRNDMQPQLDLNLDLDKITVSYAQSLGRNLSKGRKRNAMAELKALEIDLQILKRTISDEVYEAIDSLIFSHKSYRRAKKAYRLLEQIANTTREKVTQGTAARNEYLVALDKLSDVGHIISGASVDYVTALARLRLATGTLPVDSKNIKNTLNTLLTVPTNE